MCEERVRGEDRRRVERDREREYASSPGGF
jgi:hypothetical protein